MLFGIIANGMAIALERYNYKELEGNLEQDLQNGFITPKEKNARLNDWLSKETGMVVGALLGATAGLIGGPLAPVTSVLGSVGGGMLGQEFLGEAISDFMGEQGMADTMTEDEYAEIKSSRKPMTYKPGTDETNRPKIDPTGGIGPKSGEPGNTGPVDSLSGMGDLDAHLPPIHRDPNSTSPVTEDIIPTPSTSPTETPYVTPENVNQVTSNQVNSSENMVATATPPETIPIENIKPSTGNPNILDNNESNVSQSPDFLNNKNKQPVDVRVINPTPPSNVQIASSGGGGGGGGSVSTNPDVSTVNTEELLQKFNQENF